MKLIWTNLRIIIFSFKYSSFVLLKIVHMVAIEKHVPINWHFVLNHWIVTQGPSLSVVIAWIYLIKLNTFYHSFYSLSTWKWNIFYLKPTGSYLYKGFTYQWMKFCKKIKWQGKNQDCCNIYCALFIYLKAVIHF